MDVVGDLHIKTREKTILFSTSTSIMLPPSAVEYSGGTLETRWGFGCALGSWDDSIVAAAEENEVVHNNTHAYVDTRLCNSYKPDRVLTCLRISHVTWARNTNLKTVPGRSLPARLYTAANGTVQADFDRDVWWPLLARSKMVSVSYIVYTKLESNLATYVTMDICTACSLPAYLCV